MLLRNICIILMLCSSSAWSYKILMVCSPPSRSHYNLCSAVTNILAERNHDVTFIAAFAADKPNYRELLVDMSSVFKSVKSVLAMNNMSNIESFKSLLRFTPVINKAIFKTSSVKKMMDDPNEKFDLVILEYFVNQHLLGFSVKYDCPAMMLLTFTILPYISMATGNPSSPATIPIYTANFPVHMNIWQRASNAFLTILQYMVEWFVFTPVLEELYIESFPEESKKVPYSELKHKISAVMLNAHHSIGPARALLPNVAEIAGYHIQEPEPLPEDLKKILDNAKDGAILFSMGSVLPTSEISTQFKQTIINSLSKFNQTVLWKHDEEIKDLPKNIITRKWLPQLSILAHPNLKLFITHGGFLSCTEATHFAVPGLMIPVFADQIHNAKLFTDRGQGLELNFNRITESDLTRTVEELLNNPKYAENSQKISRIYHDRPIKPRDLVAYLVEHVIKTGGGSHLSPPYLPKYSHLLLDVIAMLSIAMTMILLLLRCVVKKIFGSKSQIKIKSN